MTDATGTDADKALKARHRAMWALGDYPMLASDLLPGLGTAIVEACGIGPGQRVLDIAAGSGNAAIAAAQAGASVVASDLTPELLEIGGRHAEELGLQLDWVQADAEALPFADGEFDTVISTLGIMFAPHHEASASELTRVCRPGGMIGLINWTPEGFIGQMFATMKPYSPPPPPGSTPPPRWGDEAHVRALLGDRVTEFTAKRKALPVTMFDSAEAFRDYFKLRYGPTIATYRNIADDPERVAALDQDLVELARRFDRGSGELEWEYLLVTARRAARTPRSRAPSAAGHRADTGAPRTAPPAW
ncbi:class I SAM-dependent methyltransferase [Salinibacterium sp. ZJ450]|uniref:class I SAM-dependent methyltransferase n=1 Tax=Salinibacterium sp. ZJ450 TaxID=2708338 RepID=UPI001422F188|nr:class I SAM-dependent methyltransferase [Salinibacterium sp. ZJ450]